MGGNGLYNTIKINESGVPDRETFESRDETVYRMTNYYADWIPIGIYDLTKGPVCLSLHDKGIRGGLISADAVKWVKVQER